MVDLLVTVEVGFRSGTLFVLTALTVGVAYIEVTDELNLLELLTESEDDVEVFCRNAVGTTGVGV